MPIWKWSNKLAACMLLFCCMLFVACSNQADVQNNVEQPAAILFPEKEQFVDSYSYKLFNKVDQYFKIELHSLGLQNDGTPQLKVYLEYGTIVDEKTIKFPFAKGVAISPLLKKAVDGNALKCEIGFEREATYYPYYIVDASDGNMLYRQTNTYVAN